MAALVVVLVLVVGVPLALAAALGLRNRRGPSSGTLVSGMQHRIDVETQVQSMGMSSTGYTPEDPLKSQHQ